MSTRAVDQGYEAAKAGQAPKDNPYPKDSIEWGDWFSGWELAEKQQEEDAEEPDAHSS